MRQGDAFLFPQDGPAGYDQNVFQRTGGATLRDYFASEALAGIVAHEGPVNHFKRPADYEYTAERAYGYADAMLAERSKP
jgi:hypothetical protein